MKKYIIIACAVCFFILLGILFNKTDTNKIKENSDKNILSSETQSIISSQATDEQIKTESQTDIEQIEILVEDFLKAYYNIHTEDNSKNYSLQHFEEYKIYMTQQCQSVYKPKEVDEQQNQNIGQSYNLDLIRGKIYSEINFTGGNETKVLCFIQTQTQLGDIKPNTSTALLNIKVKKENNVWLVDDIIINQLVDFPINLNTLFE